MSEIKTKKFKTVKRGPVKKSTLKKQTRKQQQVLPHQRMLMLIVKFLNDVECSLDMFNAVIPALKDQDEKTIKKIKRTVNLFKKDVKSEESGRGRTTRHIRILTKHAMKLTRAEKMFRSNSLVGLVSRYDEFLAVFLKNVFRKNPGKAISSDRAVTYDELLTLDSLDNVVELFIAKEIDGILRESHEEQLKMIDCEFKTGVLENFSEYTVFVEIMERRNLLVHAGGVVSKFYMRKCQKVASSVDPLLEEGEILEITEDYFTNSVLCLSELAVRLGYALVCRIYPDELEDIHAHLLDKVGFPLLVSEEWELARRVFSFALSWPEKYIPKDSWIRYYSLNTALALNHLKRHDEAVALLNKYDWSTQDSRFLLAVSVLRHQWKEAEGIMSGMNKEKPYAEDNFRSWPIFKEFRETREFRRAYKAVYGKRFVVRLSKEEKEDLKKVTKR